MQNNRGLYHVKYLTGQKKNECKGIGGKWERIKEWVIHPVTYSQVFTRPYLGLRTQAYRNEWMELMLVRKPYVGGIVALDEPFLTRSEWIEPLQRKTCWTVRESCLLEDREGIWNSGKCQPGWNLLWRKRERPIPEYRNFVGIPYHKCFGCVGSSGKGLFKKVSGNTQQQG